MFTEKGNVKVWKALKHVHWGTERERRISKKRVNKLRCVGSVQLCLPAHHREFSHSLPGHFWSEPAHDGANTAQNGWSTPFFLLAEMEFDRKGHVAEYPEADGNTGDEGLLQQE